MTGKPWSHNRPHQRRLWSSRGDSDVATAVALQGMIAGFALHQLPGLTAADTWQRNQAAGRRATTSPAAPGRAG